MKAAQKAETIGQSVNHDIGSRRDIHLAGAFVREARRDERITQLAHPSDGQPVAIARQRASLPRP